MRCMRDMHNARSLPRMAMTVGAGCLMVAVACGSTPPELITFGDDAYGILAAPPLPVDAPATSFDPANHLANLDGSVVMTVSGGELLFQFDGDRLASIPVSGAAELRAVSADGTMAALLERVDDVSSRITVLDGKGAEFVVRHYDLPGLVEPVAFSTDGRLLFVIDHQIADVPGAYRVRPLNLETGLLGAIFGPTKLPFQDSMNGIGRRQVWSPDGSRLYTLYIRQTHHHHADGADHAHGRAGTDGFVHVLDLHEEWAFCLDLPPGFGGGDLSTTALAVSPDGDTIAVADAGAGEVAFASTIELEVTRTAPLPDLDIEGDLHIGMTPRELAIGFGSEVHWFDRQTLTSLTDQPDRLNAPLIAITSNSQTILAWTTEVSHGPVLLSTPISSSSVGS